MDAQTLYLREHKVPELIDGLICKLVGCRPNNPRQFLADELAARSSQGDGVDDYPPFSNDSLRRPIVLQNVLSRDMFHQLRSKRTSTGVSLEECIADGLRMHWNSKDAELPSDVLPLGFYPGDEDSLTMFESVADGVLYERIKAAAIASAGGRRKSSAESASSFLSTMLPLSHDTSIGQVQGGYSFDESLCLAAAVKLRRNVRSFRLAPSISRGERMGLQNLMQSHVAQALGSTKQYLGQYTRMYEDKPLQRRGTAASLGSPTQSEANRTKATCLGLLPQPSQFVANARREWPSTSGYYCSSDWAVVVAVGTNEEHVEISSVALGNNLRDAFERVEELSNVLHNSLQATHQSGGSSDGASPYGWMFSDKYGGFVTCNLDYIHSGLSFVFVMQLPAMVTYPQFGAVLAKLFLRRLPNVASSDWTGESVVTVESCVPPLLCTPSAMLQLVATNVNTLMELESTLDCGSSIDKKVEILLSG